MTLKQRLLADETGTWLAEWVLLAMTLVTFCMMGLTAVQQSTLASEQNLSVLADG
jgi:hypothetical protein